MIGVVLRRLLSTISIMLVVAVFVFILLRIAPADPAVIIGGDNATSDQIEKIRSELGLDQAMPVQFYHWIKGIAHGDFGQSYFFKRSVSTLVVDRLEPTVALAILTLIIAVAVAVPLGVLAAAYQGRLLDRAIMVFAVIGFSVPSFVIAYCIIYVFAIKFGWLPVQGYQRLSDGFGGFLERLILPAVSLSVPYIALIARMTRANVIEVLDEDYIRTARSKGQVEFIVLARHALKNAAIPIVTAISSGIAFLLGGVIVIEVIFTIPGLGRLTADAVLAGDYPVVQAVVILLSLVCVLINLLTDIIYMLVDPRVRFQ